MKMKVEGFVLDVSTEHGFDGTIEVKMGTPCRVLGADCDFGTPMLWALVTVGGQVRTTRILMLEGQEIDSELARRCLPVDTFTQGIRTWHVFLELPDVPLGDAPQIQ